MPDQLPFLGILELLGHVRLAGRVTEEERFGGKLGRIDIPNKDGGFTTQFFNGSSIYRLTPTTEDVARHVALNCQPTPVHSWELARPALTHEIGEPVLGPESMDSPYDDETLWSADWDGKLRFECDGCGKWAPNRFFMN